MIDWKKEAKEIAAWIKNYTEKAGRTTLVLGVSECISLRSTRGYCRHSLKGGSAPIWLFKTPRKLFLKKISPIRR